MKDIASFLLRSCQRDHLYYYRDVIFDVLDMAASMYSEAVLRHHGPRHDPSGEGKGIQMTTENGAVNAIEDIREAAPRNESDFQADIYYVYTVNFFILVRNACTTLPYTRVKVKQIMFFDIDSIDVSSWISYVPTSMNISIALLAMGDLYMMGLIQHQKLKLPHIINLYCESDDIHTKISSSIVLGLILRLSPPFIQFLTGE